MPPPMAAVAKGEWLNRSKLRQPIWRAINGSLVDIFAKVAQVRNGTTSGRRSPSGKLLLRKEHGIDLGAA